MGREDPQLKLRLPEEMKDKITDAAKTMGRSVNAEIVDRLAFTLRAHPHASVMRALLNFHERLLDGKEPLSIPHGLEADVRRLADQRGISPQQFLIRVVLEALNHLDEQTELGKAFDAYLMQLDDDTSEV
ncbi:ribbon-helix-helix domain-containing protein [Rhizobium phaseoli]|uniref:Arc family DNA-binding protein n=1 Tax=Rhizobium phaseoli TaxID=396 RepID=UPI0007E99055|nr:Arc family DNA-binding protein [Rhizobium phaseoli]ANL55092.1 ribbon-helix-helix domain-containing protein [Rhizobium phaseoli]ANL67522.1 ribbon-helix-helix domain-containing protein [Rhizobium phaseoli]ANL80335.1 ribbon-helix-helix domain-containing protein [Rhizobium phaseoli]